MVVVGKEIGRSKGVGLDLLRARADEAEQSKIARKQVVVA
jgi:hypothetical protein